MLQDLRNIANKRIFQIILVIIACSFIGWGFGGGSDPSIKPVITLKVGSNVSYLEYINRRNARHAALSTTLHDPQQLDAIIINELIRERILSSIANDYELTIDDAAFIQFLKQGKYFAAKDQDFCQENFHRLLQRLNMSQDQYLAEGRQRLQQELLASTLGGSMFISGELVGQISNYLNETRTIALAKIKLNTPQRFVSVTEQELQDYYDNHQDQFSYAEKRNISYAVITSKTLGLESNETKKVVQTKKSSSRNKRSKKPLKTKKMNPSVPASHAPAVTAVIESIADQLAAGATIEEIVDQHKLTSKKLEQVSIDSLLKLESSFKDLKEKLMQIEGDAPYLLELPSNTGAILVQVNERIPAGILSFTDARQHVNNVCQQLKVKEANLARITKEAKDLTASNFKTLATKYGMQVSLADIMRHSTDELPLGLLEELYSAPVGQVSSVYSDGSYAYVAVVEKISKLKPANTQQDGIRNDILTDYLQEVINYFAKKHDLKVRMPLAS